MSSSQNDKLEKRIAELEAELKSRETDISIYKTKLQETNERLEKLIFLLSSELKATEKLQQLLMPTEHANIPGFEFSSKFKSGSSHGGDYFDVFELIDKARFGMIMASCSGYGVSALLLTVLLKMTGQIEARRGAEPHILLELISKEIQNSLKPNESFDMFYSIFNRKTFTLSYCRIGEVIGLQQDYVTGKIKLFEACSESIGYDDSIQLSSDQIVLNPRDRVILCSPGLFQVQNLEGEPFGIERLYQAILSAPNRGVHELRNEILFQVEQFSGGQTVKRDRTLVIAEVKDRVIKLASR